MNDETDQADLTDQADFFTIMSAENEYMNGELQAFVLRAYEKRGITTEKFPFVAMDEGGLWYAYEAAPQKAVLSTIWLAPEGGLYLGEYATQLIWKDSCYVWNAEAKVPVRKGPMIQGLDYVIHYSDHNTSQEAKVEDAIGGRVWVDLGHGSALRCDVVRVTEALPTPHERVRYDLPSVEELDGCFARPWSEAMPHFLE